MLKRKVAYGLIIATLIMCVSLYIMEYNKQKKMIMETKLGYSTFDYSRVLAGFETIYKDGLLSVAPDEYKTETIEAMDGFYADGAITEEDYRLYNSILLGGFNVAVYLENHTYYDLMDTFRNLDLLLPDSYCILWRKSYVCYQGSFEFRENERAVHDSFNLWEKFVNSSGVKCDE